MSVFLGGGGNAAQSIVLDRAFAAKVGTGPVVYWPMAMASHPDFATCEAWFRRTFEPLGVRDVDLWPSLRDRDLGDVAGAAGLYIGGGNTYHLLHALKSADALGAIRKLVEGGLPVYGGSAGAVVLGADISTVAGMDVNDIGITDVQGVDLLMGHSVWVHYEPSDRTEVESWSLQHGKTEVLALAEDAGAIVEGSMVVSCGQTPARLLTPDTVVELEDGASLELSSR